MQTKSFTTAGVVSLFGCVLWMTSSSGCSSSDAATVPNPDAGNAETGTSTSSSSGSSSSSSGSSLDDAGIDPNTVPGAVVTYGKCPTFTKCDGAVKGDYDVSGGCLDDSTFDQYKKACAGLSIHDVVIKASGTVDATDDHITQNTSVFVSAKADIDKANCFGLSALNPGKDPKDFDCTQIGVLLTSGFGGPKFDTADCVQGPGTTCNCLAQATVKEPGTAAKYTTDGKGDLTTTTEAGTGKRTYEYCPNGTKTEYRETTDNNATFSMFLELTKK